MNCAKCEKPVKSKSDCVIVYDYSWYFFKLPPQLIAYHKSCFSEHKAKSGPIATVDSTQLKRLNDSSFKLLIFWIVIGIIPLILFIALLIQGSELSEALTIALVFSIPSSLFILIYKSRLKTIKEIENLP
ncbi:hypothetical protein HYX06_00980 [Candidatus Woesearchaeota archaeon]|nr:hypothetical protein [Candidatus Woesearchaeota archaeon]